MAPRLLPVLQLADARPDLLGRRAQQLEDVQELLQLGVAREQRRLQSGKSCVARQCFALQNLKTVQQVPIEPVIHEKTGIGWKGITGKKGCGS